jgi:hypothetical protein
MLLPFFFLLDLSSDHVLVPDQLFPVFFELLLILCNFRHILLVLFIYQLFECLSDITVEGMFCQIDQSFQKPVELVFSLHFAEGSLSVSLLKTLRLIAEKVDLLYFLNFMRILVHNLLVHVFDIALYLLVVVADRSDFLLVLLQFELVIVLDRLHILSVPEVQNQLPLYPLDDGLLIFQLLLQIALFTVVFILVTS